MEILQQMASLIALCRWKSQQSFSWEWDAITIYSKFSTTIIDRSGRRWRRKRCVVQIDLWNLITDGIGRLHYYYYGREKPIIYLRSSCGSSGNGKGGACPKFLATFNAKQVVFRNSPVHCFTLQFPFTIYIVKHSSSFPSCFRRKHRTCG